MRLPTAVLLSLMLTACGQSGALYFAKPERAKTESAKPNSANPEQEPAASTDKNSTENSDTTTGP